MKTGLVALWYGSIWLLLLVGVAYAARGGAVTSPPLVISLALLIAFSTLAWRHGTRAFACLALTTLVVPVYLFELFLWVTTTPGTGAKSVHAIELREQGVQAYPAVFPSGILDLARQTESGGHSPIVVEGREILPLAGIPDVPTVYCQRADLSMITYQSDGYGFRSPVSTQPSAVVDFGLLGDSLAQGYCVPDPSTYASQLSRVGKTISYGVNGSSTLTQLAIYREYTKYTSIRHVIWFFFEDNDLEGYIQERNEAILKLYLDDDYLQNLVDLNQKISIVVREFVDERLAFPGAAALAHEESPNIMRGGLDFLVFRRSRSLFDLLRNPKPMSGPSDLTVTEWQDLTDIWKKVVDAQCAAGGALTFVYIPAPWRFLDIYSDEFRALERKVVSLWSSLDVDYLSLTDVLEATGDPIAYYDNGTHFNEEGYRLTGDALIDHLRSPKEPAKRQGIQRSEGSVRATGAGLASARHCPGAGP